MTHSSHSSKSDSAHSYKSPGRMGHSIDSRGIECEAAGVGLMRLTFDEPKSLTDSLTHSVSSTHPRAHALTLDESQSEHRQNPGSSSSVTVSIPKETKRNRVLSIHPMSPNKTRINTACEVRTDLSRSPQARG